MNCKTIDSIREVFPALKQKVYGKELVYFDNAATAQKPEQVISLINSMNSGINGNIHRAVHELSAKCTEMYENAREEIRSFINAESTDEIIFTSGATASINLVAGSFASGFLKRGDTVIISMAEHHSNIVPWQLACERTGARLRVIPIDDTGNLRLDLFEKMIDTSVKIVAITHISNVLGLVNPVEEIINIAHSHGVPVLIDGAQGIVHSKVDVNRMNCDFYLFSGHKLYGPTGIGILYGKRELLEQMPPWMGGGDMVGTVTFDKTTYAELPLKFEAGTPNFIGGAALGEAVKFVKQLDESFVIRHDDELVDYLQRELIGIDGLKLFGRGKNKIPLFSFTIQGVHSADLAMVLDKMGIAVRSGQMCCEPLMTHYGEPGMLRASLLVYNTLDEAEYFIKSLHRAIKMFI